MNTQAIPINNGKYLVKRELSLSESYMKYVYGHPIPETEEAELVLIDGVWKFKTTSGRLIEA